MMVGIHELVNELLDEDELLLLDEDEDELDKDELDEDDLLELLELLDAAGATAISCKAICSEIVESICAVSLVASAVPYPL